MVDLWGFKEQRSDFMEQIFLITNKSFNKEIEIAIFDNA